MKAKQVPESVIKGITNKSALVDWMLNNIDHNLILQCLQPSAISPSSSDSGPSQPIEEIQEVVAELPPAQQQAAATQAVAEELGLDEILNDPEFTDKATITGDKYFGVISTYCPMIEHLAIDEKTKKIAGKFPGLKGPKAPFHRLFVTKEKLLKFCKAEADKMLADIKRKGKGKAPVQGFGAIRAPTGFFKGVSKTIQGVGKAASKVGRMSFKGTRGFINPQQASLYATSKAIKSGKSVIGSNLAGKMAYKKAQGYNRRLASLAALKGARRVRRGNSSLRNLPRSFMAFGATNKEEFKALRGLRRRAGGAIRGLKSGISTVKRRDKGAVKRGRKVGGIKGKLTSGVGRTINVGMAIPTVGASTPRGFLRPSRTTRRSRFGAPKTTKKRTLPPRIPSKALRARAQKLGIRVTKTRGGKRVYKTAAELEAAIKKKMASAKRTLPKRTSKKPTKRTLPKRSAKKTSKMYVKY